MGQRGAAWAWGHMMDPDDIWTQVVARRGQIGHVGIRVYVCMYVCMYVYIYIYVYLCFIDIYIYIYIIYSLYV